MGDGVITVVAIVLAAVLMFIFPLMSASERSDDMAQLDIQALTTQFVDNIRVSGKLTNNNYNAFIQKLSSTGNSYDVEVEFKIQDANIGKKTGQGQISATKVGENVYYSEYTSQIVNVLNDNAKNNTYSLKEGDIVSVNVKNTNKTISQLLRSFFYNISGNDSYQVAASHAGIVTSTGR